MKSTRTRDFLKAQKEWWIWIAVFLIIVIAILFQDWTKDFEIAIKGVVIFLVTFSTVMGAKFGSEKQSWEDSQTP